MFLAKYESKITIVLVAKTPAHLYDTQLKEDFIRINHRRDDNQS